MRPGARAGIEQPVTDLVRCPSDPIPDGNPVIICKARLGGR